ncbi:hypothetical protein ABPG74_006398 [Tetrahymena malaccensis]
MIFKSINRQIDDKLPMISTFFCSKLGPLQLLSGCGTLIEIVTEDMQHLQCILHEIPFKLIEAMFQKNQLDIFLEQQIMSVSKDVKIQEDTDAKYSKNVSFFNMITKSITEIQQEGNKLPANEIKYIMIEQKLQSIEKEVTDLYIN